MDITISKEVTEETISKLTFRAVHILFIVQGLTEKKRLFTGHYDQVEISRVNETDLAVIFKLKGKPGFFRKTFKADFVRLISHDWMNNPILNRSGLAAQIWNDDIPNKLRRRLEQKTNRGTLSVKELDQIVLIVDNFNKDVQRSVEIYKAAMS